MMAQLLISLTLSDLLLHNFCLQGFFVSTRRQDDE